MPLNSPLSSHSEKFWELWKNVFEEKRMFAAEFSRQIIGSFSKHSRVLFP
jgi:hypothetical protein